MQQSLEILYTEVKWHSSPFKAIQMWGITALFIIAQFFLQLSIGVIATEISKDLALNSFELSLIASSYYITYVIFQIPAGLLIDRFGCRIILTIGAIVCCSGCFLFAKTQILLLAILGRILMGGSMSFAFIASIYVAAKWFPIKHLALMTGLAETVAMIGAIGGNLILAEFMLYFTWKNCYLVFSVALLFLAILCWAFLKDGPTSSTIKQTNNKLGLSQLFSNLWLLLKIKNIWFLGIYAGICYTVITVYTALWEIPFLLQAYNLDLWTATFVTSFGYLGVGIGSPLFPWKFTTITLKKRLMIMAPLVLCASMVLLIYAPNHNLYILSLLNFLLGMGTSVAIFSYTIAPGLAPVEAKNTSIGIVNTLALITAPIFQTAIGAILNLQTLKVAAPVTNYYIALSVLPICMLIATILPMCIKFEQNKVQ